MSIPPLSIPLNWTFERPDVAEAFDRHVREQLPWYDLTTGAVVHVVRHYLPAGGLVYDIGASTGNIGRALAPVLEERKARFVPVEASADMCLLYAGPQPENLTCQDALAVDYAPFDVAVLYLTTMFLPVAERGAFLRALVARAKPGGVVVVVDKVRAASGYPATVLWRLTLAGKAAAGTPADQIVSKELSLGGVQRPLAPEELPPSAVEWFRFGDFAGWLIEAPPAQYP